MKFAGIVRFSSAARSAMKRAEALTIARGRATVSSAALLLALAEVDPELDRALSVAGYGPTERRHQLDGEIATSAGGVRGRPRPSDALWHVIAESRRQARADGRRVVEANDPVDALLRDGTSAGDLIRAALGAPNVEAMLDEFVLRIGGRRHGRSKHGQAVYQVPAVVAGTAPSASATSGSGTIRTDDTGIRRPSGA